MNERRDGFKIIVTDCVEKVRYLHGLSNIIQIHEDWSNFFLLIYAFAITSQTNDNGLNKALSCISISMFSLGRDFV